MFASSIINYNYIIVFNKRASVTKQMIILFTDFGWEGPYVGQLKAVAAQQVASCPVIDMVHDLPKYNTKAASYFIAAIMQVVSLFSQNSFE